MRGATDGMSQTMLWRPLAGHGASSLPARLVARRFAFGGIRWLRSHPIDVSRSQQSCAVLASQAGRRAWSSGETGARAGAYPFRELEPKWQAHWEEHKTFRTPDFHELDTSKPKYYVLDMFPYPRLVEQRESVAV